MSLIDEGEVGAEKKKRMMGFLPVDTCVYLSGAEKVSGPTVEISVNLDCSNRAGGSKDRTVSEREACCRYSTWVVSRVPTPFGISNECVWGFNFGAATVHVPKVLLPRVVCSRSLAQVSASVGEGCSHVVGHVDGVQLVSQEGVS